MVISVDHQGPVSTYMASCNGDCTKFPASSAKWFKLDAGGYDPTSRQWAADKLRASEHILHIFGPSSDQILLKDDNSWVSTIPAELAPGQYASFIFLITYCLSDLVNSLYAMKCKYPISNRDLVVEIKILSSVALHSITPQFYPSCSYVLVISMFVCSHPIIFSQVKVTGTGTKQPSESDLVSIPGLYSGATWPNIYSDFGTFTIPGPPPVTFGAGGNAPPISPTVTSAQATTSTTGTQISNTSTAAPVTSSQPSTHCLLASRRLIRRLSK